MPAGDLNVPSWCVTDDGMEGAEAEEAMEEIEAPGASVGGPVVEMNRMREGTMGMILP